LNNSGETLSKICAPYPLLGEWSKLGIITGILSSLHSCEVTKYLIACSYLMQFTGFFVIYFNVLLILSKKRFALFGAYLIGLLNRGTTIAENNLFLYLSISAMLLYILDMSAVATK